MKAVTTLTRTLCLVVACCEASAAFAQPIPLGVTVDYSLMPTTASSPARVNGRISISETGVPFRFTWANPAPVPIPWRLDRNGLFMEQGTVFPNTSGPTSRITSTLLDNNVQLDLSAFYPSGHPLAGQVAAFGTGTEGVSDVTLDFQSLRAQSPLTDGIISDFIKKQMRQGARSLVFELFPNEVLDGYANTYGANRDDMDDFRDQLTETLASEAFNQIAPVLASLSFEAIHKVKIGSSNPHKGPFEGSLSDFGGGLSSTIQDIIGPGAALLDRVGDFVDVDIDVDSALATPILLQGGQEIFANGDIDGVVSGLKLLQIRKLEISVPWTPNTPTLPLQARLGVIVSGISATEIGGTGVSGSLGLKKRVGALNINFGVGGSAVYDFNTQQLDPQLSNGGALIILDQ